MHTVNNKIADDYDQIWCRFPHELDNTDHWKVAQAHRVYMWKGEWKQVEGAELLLLGVLKSTMR